MTMKPADHRRSIARPVRAFVLASAFASTGPGIAEAADAATAPPSVETDAPASTGLGAGDWLLRARIMGLLPHGETSDVGLIGGRIETPDQIMPDGEMAYFLTDHVSLEVQGGIALSKPKIVDTVVGTLEIGSIWSAAVSTLAQYHFRPEARLNPYVGAGASVSWPVRIDPAAGIADFDIERLVSPMVQVGFDYQLSDDWFANAMAKYVFVPGQTYSGGGASFKSDLDMVVVGVGIGYRL